MQTVSGMQDKHVMVSDVSRTAGAELVGVNATDTLVNIEQPFQEKLHIYKIERLIVAINCHIIAMTKDGSTLQV